MKESEDTGKHYRFTYRVTLKEQDIKNGFVDVKLDPYRIFKIYKIVSPPIQHLLKKGLCCGNRGHNDYKEDVKDIICAAKRELEMLEEDEVGLSKPMFADIRPVNAKIDYELRD